MTSTISINDLTVSNEYEEDNYRYLEVDESICYKVICNKQITLKNVTFEHRKFRLNHVLH